MRFLADLHLHSRYSIATSKEMVVPRIAGWAQVKGVLVMGTGDFTHPGWLGELKDGLVPAEEGLFRLRPDLVHEAKAGLPPHISPEETRFLLTCEVSSIYKKNGRVRKVHSLIFADEFESAQKIHRTLASLGNVEADGRPILGLEAKTILEIVKGASPDAHLVTAHAWTPHFSVLGAASGFDTLEECFEELTGEVLAVETGLSSDPGMNWRVGFLDDFPLISNSDAHSPSKIGREANILDTDLSYPGIVEAISGRRHGFEGTIEFFPEEGKYHLDGHRNCKVRLWPEETARVGGACPECGRPVTVGVMHRVEELASHPRGRKPARAKPYERLVGLAEILSEVMSRGPATKTVTREYFRVVEGLGSELFILREAEIPAIEELGGPVLAEAVARIRRGEVSLEPGFDGQYGTVTIFGPGERERTASQGTLFPD